MPWRRAPLVACALASCAVVCVLVAASCGTEGDVLVLLPRIDASTGDAPADVLVGDTRDTSPSGEDVSELHCQNEAGSCRYPEEQCCLELLTMFCTKRGECDAGGVECSRSAHCGPGLRCCAQGAAFSITSACRAECPVYQLCATDGECADAGRCVEAGAAGFATCQ